MVRACTSSVKKCAMGLQVDLLPEIGMPPLYRPPPDNMLPASLRSEVQSYIATRQPEGFPATLARRMALSSTDASMCDLHYNVPMLNAFVFYVGLSVRPYYCPDLCHGQSYICHAPAMRAPAATCATDGPQSFQVTDMKLSDDHCCASVCGYQNPLQVYHCLEGDDTSLLLTGHSTHQGSIHTQDAVSPDGYLHKAGCGHGPRRAPPVH